MTGQPKRYAVLLTRGAEQGLESIYDYIAEHESRLRADQVLDRLMDVVASLGRLPERGNYPKELLALGIKAFRQTAFKPYRVIYRVAEKDVHILLIVDGRRDMQQVLSQRLLSA